MKRKEFIRRALPAFLLLANGKIVKAHDYWLTAERKKQIRLRFAIASDGHYGEEGTDYERYFSAIVSALNPRSFLPLTANTGDTPLPLPSSTGISVTMTKTISPLRKRRLTSSAPGTMYPRGTTIRLPRRNGSPSGACRSTWISLSVKMPF